MQTEAKERPPDLGDGPPHFTAGMYGELAGRRGLTVGESTIWGTSPTDAVSHRPADRASAGMSRQNAVSPRGAERGLAGGDERAVGDQRRDGAAQARRQPLVRAGTADRVHDTAGGRAGAGGGGQRCPQLDPPRPGDELDGEDAGQVGDGHAELAGR